MLAQIAKPARHLGPLQGAVIALLLLASASIARAEGVAECHARLKDAVQCYVTNAKFHLLMCSMKVEMAVLKNESDTSCIPGARQEVEPFFVAASKSLSRNKSAQNLLKDTHAYWLASIIGLRPNSGETMQDYKRRVQQREQGFNEKVERLIIEK